ncbi:MAG: hypothetical protein AUH35_02555 [Nitrospirae bacterium 13_1_40CM_62_7]|nr:MAG: hypothetical protein AUH35_02555 [Nitrospirae bacterium 13_1_40CM_62_7]
MVTITLMGQLQTADGERELACEIAEPTTVRQLIQQQGAILEEVLQLMREKKLMVTVNKRIASERACPHFVIGRSSLAPSRLW